VVKTEIPTRPPRRESYCSSGGKLVYIAKAHQEHGGVRRGRIRVLNNIDSKEAYYDLALTIQLVILVFVHVERFCVNIGKSLRRGEGGD